MANLMLNGNQYSGAMLNGKVLFDNSDNWQQLDPKYITIINSGYTDPYKGTFLFKKDIPDKLLYFIFNYTNFGNMLSANDVTFQFDLSNIVSAVRDPGYINGYGTFDDARESTESVMAGANISGTVLSYKFGINNSFIKPITGWDAFINYPFDEKTSTIGEVTFLED